LPWNGTEQCGIYKPTSVISISYSLPEAYYSRSYAERQCDEFLKLGLQGVSLIVSSADYAVEGIDLKAKGVICLDTSGHFHVNGSSFNPGWPVSCPWVTAVGGTFPNGLGNSTFVSETAWDFSGGGFSNYFRAPAYQQSTIAEWFRAHNPGYNASIFNHAGRGYPDVSAIAGVMPFYLDGVVGGGAGTSLSAPIFAAIIALINQARYQVGKGPVGFLNPTLYANPQAFNDITTGSDYPDLSCGTKGFAAVEGWDPISGLGTPNYAKLLEVYMELP